MICRKHPEQYPGVPCAKCIAEAWSDYIVDEPKETEVSPHRTRISNSAAKTIGGEVKYIITECLDGGWMLQQQENQTIWPTVIKKTKREVIARLMQLMDVGPVRPQTEPEKIVFEEE